MVKLILLVVLIGTVTVAGLQVAVNRGLIKNNPLGSALASLTQFTQPVAKLIPANVSDQVGVLSARTGAVSQEVGTVLGSSIQVEKEELPLHQKAFQHARYLYCQQVVNDYEARMATPSATASPSL